MKKIFVILLCLLLAGVLVWLIRPGYGTGYSEDQRRLWNERKRLYPVGWGMTDMFRLDELSFYEILTGKAGKAVEKQLKSKQEEEQELAARLEENRDESGPDYRMNIPASTEVSRLPLEGLTRRETAARALSGDGNACLKMAQLLFADGTDGVMSLTWRQRHEADKWLDRAIRLKRPGAVFIKSYLTEVRNAQLAAVVSGGKEHQVPWPAGQTLPGYADFEDSLKRGDFLLYRTAIRMRDVFEPLGEYPLIDSSLRKRAEKGDAESLVNLGELYFLSPNGYSSFLYNAVVEDLMIKTENWKKWLGWLPASWRQEAVGGLFACGLMNADRLPSMSGYRQVCRYAREAARKGNLNGMYLWLMGGVPVMDSYSAGDWHDILEYSRILLEAGYAPYIERMQRTHIPASDYAELNDQILRSFYSKKSYDEFWEKDYMTSRGGKDKRYYCYVVGEEIINRNDSAETRVILDDLDLTGETGRLLRILMTDGVTDRLFPQCDREVQVCLLERMERWAAEGDPHAMYVLSAIYEKGISVPADLGRAHALLKTALAEAVRYPLMTILVKNETDRPMWKSVYLETAIRLRMADMVLTHPDFPGRDEREAFDAALKASQAPPYMPEYEYPTEAYRILGQLYERGAGVPADRDKALEYYELGVPYSKTCREGVDRLLLLGAGKRKLPGK